MASSRTCNRPADPCRSQPQTLQAALVRYLLLQSHRAPSACRLQHFGTLQTLQSAVQRARDNRRRRAHMRGQSVLPPLQLQFLPPPISFGHARAHIDLNVDFKTEVEPFLGRCLVSSYCVSHQWVRLCVEA